MKVKDAFYFKPSANEMAFERIPVRINTLNSILPELCKAVGIVRKTAHSLRVTCLSTFFNNGVYVLFRGSMLGAQSKEGRLNERTVLF